jgi:hypothetical protein
MFYSVGTVLTLTILVVVGVWNWKLVTDRLVPKYKYLETDFFDYFGVALGYLAVSVIVSIMWPLLLLVLTTLAIKAVVSNTSNRVT